MTSFDFVDSQYRFTNPIRFFKANDPIYYEVDNIPLKQLQENDLWLKDQIFNLKLSTEGGVERQNINELRPYVNGFDNVVNVKPGRFTARINDAYNITPLQVVTKLTSSGVEDYNTWEVAGLSAPQVASILSRFKQAVALDMNGLAERAFAKLAFIPDVADTTYSNATLPQISVILGSERAYAQPPYPGVGAVLWTNFNDSRDSTLTPTFYRVRQYDPNVASVGFARMGLAETAFIKKWRGIARTAVVDVGEDLSIEIPAFNDEDHFYIDEQGVKRPTPATQRVDLLFIYSKPVDTSSTTIAKFVNGSPTVITRPQLGIVYGAGIGVNFRGGPEKKQEVLTPAGVDKGDFPGGTDTTLPDGTMKMLSHYGDENGVNTGFITSSSSIKGSFPSPDDLMNIAPLLDESLNSNNIALIGQSVLPIAYVVVRKDANLNTDGSPIIDSSDLIDIRPFFRTTELTYNERAGIAAAVPAPSIANPIVTQAELDYEIKKMRTDVISRIPTIPDVPSPVYQTLYIPDIQDVYLDEPYRVFLRRGNDIGSSQNPFEFIIGQDVISSGNPVSFISQTSQPEDVYSRYMTEILIHAEATHLDTGYQDPIDLYLSIVDANTSFGGIRKFSRVATAGHVGNSYNYGAGVGRYSGRMWIPIQSNQPITMSNPSRLPIVMNTFVSTDTWLSDAEIASGASRNLPSNFKTMQGVKYNAPYAPYAAKLLTAVYIVGYRLRKLSRIKAILA